MVGAFFMGAAGQNRRFLAKAYMGVRATVLYAISPIRDFAHASANHSASRYTDLHLTLTRKMVDGVF